MLRVSCEHLVEEPVQLMPAGVPSRHWGQLGSFMKSEWGRTFTADMAFESYGLKYIAICCVGDQRIC